MFRMLSALAAALAWVVIAPAIADAQGAGLGADDVELADVLDIQLLGRDLYAHDGTGSGRTHIRLDLHETVLSQRAQGRIGLVLTDQRALAVSAGSSGWREERYRSTETREDSGLLGERIALVLTSQRALGFNAGSGTWIAESLGPTEVIQKTQVGPGTAVLITNRRAIGMSPNSGGFVDIAMRVHEELERVSTLSGVATVTTSQRVLIFQGTNARWVVQRRKIHE